MNSAPRWMPGLFIVALLIPAVSLAEVPVIYPRTHAGTVADTVFGERVADPYRWLENDVRSDPTVRDWVTAQNEVSGAYLAKLPGRDIFARRLRTLFDYERVGVPAQCGRPLFLFA